MSLAAPQPSPAPAPKLASANRAWLRALELTGRIERAPERLLSTVVEEWAALQPDAPALLSDIESLTYSQLARRSRRYSRWALSEGLVKGDVVALMADNSPDYLATWLGLTRVGIVVALINTSLRGEGLAHCLSVAGPKRLIAAASIAEVACAAAAMMADAPPIWTNGGQGARIDEALADVSDEPLSDDEAPVITVRDPALLIYTSGTTGLPKAARVSHHRVMSWSGWFAGMMDASKDDRLYDCLPMHHSVGGVVALGAMLMAGGAVVLAPRFSLSRFWDDIVRWDCTLFQYIGELCRYLVNAPRSANERRHRLRMACGNGLRPEVWTPFQERFAIPRILEFYAATEGNFSLYNVEGQPGAIGRVPAFMAHRFPIALVRFDHESAAPVRGLDGFCQRCEAGEVGEAIGGISADDGDPAQRFEGYTSGAESEKKVLRDVFAPGDAWLRTGDLMRTDKRGFYAFVDRIGDTFRWKGENVSTGEVAAAVRACPGVEAAHVYGVVAPGADGKAGMAAIVAGESFDLATLRAHLVGALPVYARPLFLRIVARLDVTETFKQKAGGLAADGFDPARIADPLFFDDARCGAYRRLDEALATAIAHAQVRL